MQELPTLAAPTELLTTIGTESSQCIRSFNRERVNLESHQLVWLNDNVNKSNDNDTTLKEDLRKIVDYTKLFDNVEQCLQYIEETKDSITFLVCSEQFGEILVPQIYHLQNIWSIYIYCHNKEYHQNWTTNYSKIKQVHTTLEDLLKTLSENVEEYKRLDINTTIFTTYDKDKTTDYSPHSWWIYFIDVLVHIPYEENYCLKLINELKSYYAENSPVIPILEEFESNYKPETAVHWYTRNTFLYRVLNEGLRQHNIKLMFLFGFYIQDMYQQLKEEHEKFKLEHLKNPITTVYRGQLMSRDEIKVIERDSYTVNNSFFSTTLNRSLALMFLNSISQPNDELQNVLFTIDIDVRNQRTLAYGNISNLSQFPEESEILFMIGTEFQKIKVSYDKNENIWIIKLKLGYNSTFRVDEYHERLIKRRTLKNSVGTPTQTDSNFIRFSSFQDKNLLFNELLILYPSEKWFLAIKYFCQARSQGYETGADKHAILSNCEKALEIWHEYINDDELNCYVDIAQIHREIFWFHINKIEDLNTYKKHYELAINYYQLAIDKALTDYEKAVIYVELSSVYKIYFTDDKNEREDVRLMAIKYMELCLELTLKYRSSNDFMIGDIFQELGRLYESIQRYDDALNNYDKALEIYLQQAESSNGAEMSIIACIVPIYTKYKNNYQLALKYQLIKHEYKLKLLATEPTMDDEGEIDLKKNQIAGSHLELADIYIELQQYDLTYEHLTTAIKLYKETNHPTDEAIVLFEKYVSCRKISS
ncbi:unnamed protein product [Didymodactylos carnosus]|uniref:NAD(P)(+)--arginine ADP-ribosyltransferase n=1 Tax=Didymodactylos carnosus TaxID=1234261 RepID=A0A814CXG0_9BILA|nr:unnamed protein product [Didymodactylos carnosus]CAF1081533.1 unnamed protein product [Didymodactylos carnosus]CAF3722790.1 unnamed protein product [Didymodactylos carnosus]CAF3844432.1 unnamed protein product [Didymodactylos carnosus]